MNTFSALKKTILKTLPLLIFAPVFGALYGALLEFFQTDFIKEIYGDCCLRCANILYDREQPILAFCAALSFAAVILASKPGWRGVLRIIAVTFLSFQIYSLLMMWSVLRAEECTALHRVRAFPLLMVLILTVYSLFLSGFWAAICATPLIIFNWICSIVSTNRDDFQKLDLNFK